MKAIMVMFDSLNRRLLPNYGGSEIAAPNFERLTGRTVTFDNCYAGSMPCVPARRELHTGRYNFLHRSWGPLEPFDDSVPQMLGEGGVYTHLVTDHKHYWGDGGATYHNRFSSYEFFRGQEGDRWKGHVANPEIPEAVIPRGDAMWRQDWINRQYLDDEQRHPQTLTFDAGIDFITHNAGDENWFVQIESYDPHEPFFTYEHYRQLYEKDYSGRHQDWPSYRKVIESDAEVEHLRNQYFALATMCDTSLGRVLDLMDEKDLWKDTMLIVCTDHGLLLGEHGWWGKGVQPWYDENVHTPLFIWDPRSGARAERRASLVQTVDFGPTLLEYFNIDRTPDMHGRPLAATIVDDSAVREAALFGSAGGHVNVTDGRYVYMRACHDESNSPLSNYTLMPMHMAARFSADELRDAELVPPFDFTKGMPVLRTPTEPFGNPYHFGTLLFDLRTDPEQCDPLIDDELELQLATMLVGLMRKNDAPNEQYERLGLPRVGDVERKHLQCRNQRELVLRSLERAPTVADFEQGSVIAEASISELAQQAETWADLCERYPVLRHAQALDLLGSFTLIEAAALVPTISLVSLRDFEKGILLHNY